MNSALLGACAALSWGVHDFLARFPSRSIGPVNAVFAVTLSGLILLSLWLLASGTTIDVVWPSLWLTAVTGIFFALATLSLFAALTLGPISIVCPIAGSYPAVAMLFAVAAGARPDVLQWLAIAAVVTGVAAVAQSGGRQGRSGALQPGKLPAVLGLSLLASLAFAISLTSGQFAVPVFGNAQAAWLARVFGLAFIALLYLHPSARWQAPGRWLPLLGLMGGLDVAALTLIVAAGNLADPALATVTSSAFGAVTVLLARVFLKERIAPVQLGGIVLIVGGVAVLASR